MFAKLHDISVNFGEVRALNNVSLDISPNQIHAIVGENGAGKSTLMSVLFGLNVNYGGQIFIDEIYKNWATPSDAIKADTFFNPEATKILFGVLRISSN